MKNTTAETKQINWVLFQFRAMGATQAELIKELFLMIEDKNYLNHNLKELDYEN